MSTRRRLDAELVRRGLARSREHAAELVTAGRVVVAGQSAGKTATQVTADDPIAVQDAGTGPDYASRGGRKLAGALAAFPGLSVAGRRCLDAGASTGGFTDVLLRYDAALVYAVDVGYGQLDGRLSRDPRVRVMDRTNLRLLRELPGPRPSLVTLDLSFISLRSVLPQVAVLAEPRAEVVCLFKPQFEVGRGAVGKGGIVRDAELVETAVRDFLDWAVRELGATVAGPIPSPISGAKGNRELLVHLRLPEAAA
jgi:23S rRNA (cytidine1920-2'-O)/16S rRNA (cytidine1409-2'-O)-methyltransferase